MLSKLLYVPKLEKLYHTIPKLKELFKGTDSNSLPALE